MEPKTTSSTEGAVPYFDPEAARRAIEFFPSYLRHIKGKWAGRPFRPEPWQAEGILAPLFGHRRADGTRRYRKAYIEIPRKNGKSTLSAGIALKLTFADGEYGAEVYSAAADRDQAAIVFDAGKAMVEGSPRLRRRARIYRRVIEVPKTYSVWRVLSADAYTKHGLSAHGVIFDEVHAQPNRELWDVLTTSTGARSQPLIVGITTAGDDFEGICWELHDYAIKVMRGIVDDPSFFAYVRAAPLDADWKDEAVWRDANPAIDGGFRNLDEMRDMFRQAQVSEGLANTFRRLYLNQWIAAKARGINLDAWDTCEPFRPPARGARAYGGLDLASTSDIAAFLLVFPRDGGYDVLPRGWIPEAALRGKEPWRDALREWAERGLVVVTDGDTIDFGAIRRDILALADEYNIVEVAFDPWQAVEMAQHLAAEGMVVWEHRQNMSRMSAPSKELLRLVGARKWRSGGNPVLRWMADNIVWKTDSDGNIRPDREASSGKIDGIVAGIMAISAATREREAPRELSGPVAV